MELLEFKNKMLKLCGVSEIGDIGDILMTAVLKHDIDFFEKYNSIVDDSKDWLQALWQYYEADRTEKKQDYTPKSLCKLVSAISGCGKSVYDCCGGSGALTVEVLKTGNIDNVYVEELDKRVIPFLLFNLCLTNANGYVINGNALTCQQFKRYKLIKGEKYSSCIPVNTIDEFKTDVSISNPPFNIKWNPPTQLEAYADGRFPVVPPASNANFAFVFNCLSKSDKVIMILPCEIMSKSTEIEIRKYLVDNDLIDIVAVMPEKMFEVTSISTCVLVLNKHKKNRGFVKFIDSRKNCIVEKREQNGQFGGASHTNRTYIKSYNVLSDENIQRILNSPNDQAEFSATVANGIIAENDYLLTPSRYIEFICEEQKHRDFQEIADNINYITRMKNSCKLVINETIAKERGFDIETFKSDKESSKSMKEKLKSIGINVEADDYIQFTKNKNEFVFKCNDKELLPDIFIQFFNIWKNQIALLNTMQNQYLTELRDALLPDLMSGKIDVSNVTVEMVGDTE